MGRGRAKGKKLSATNQDDTGSGEDEKIPAQKRRGRPQKSLKDDIDEDEALKLEDEDSEDTTGVPSNETKGKTATQKKRKRNVPILKEKADSMKEDNGNGTRSSTEESNKSNSSFRPNGNRRKSKPRRAAEAVVECN